MKPEILARFKKLAARNAKHRKDVRFKDTVGFLVAKGLLGTNREILLRPNARLDLADAIWAGKNVEPRILEVLPAAVARFPKHFRIPVNPAIEEKHLLATATALKKDLPEGEPFIGIEYRKLRIWMDAPIRDRRTRAGKDRKKMKSFRLRADAIAKLSRLARDSKSSEAEVIERLLLAQGESD